MNVDLFLMGTKTVSDQPVEYVERKGLGHPDTICDGVMEAAASALRAEYRRECGRVLHHNLDKALLVAGQSEPILNGGRVISPMQIIAGDRATSEVAGTKISVDEIVESAVLDWIGDHLRCVDPQQHVRFRSEIKPGSAQLTGIFDRDIPVANDTSAAVGFAPLSETEQIVLAAEQYINSVPFKDRFPVTGEDVKVMAIRHGRRIRMTIAVAMIDRFVPTEESYFEQKESIRCDIQRYVTSKLKLVDEIEVDLNMLDDPALGMSGMYLTVLGTSAESGDGGEVGRGNAVNGLISLHRPTSNEAAAGKNTTCHVGNIYNHLSHAIAREIVDSMPPVREAYVWLCSQIGQPIDHPWSTSVGVTLQHGVEPHDVKRQINETLHTHLRSAVKSS